MERHINLDAVSSRLRLEEFGLGTVEYIIRLSGEGEVLQQLLADTDFWQSIDAFANEIIEDGQLPLQKQWKGMADLFQKAVKLSNTAFKEMDDFLIARPRADDLCWTRGLNLVIFRHKNAAREERNEKQNNDDIIYMKHFAKAFNAGAAQDVKGYYLDVGRGSLDLLANGFGIVALVSEDIESQGKDKLGTPSQCPSKCLWAIWRNIHMNYAALTEAADGMRSKIEESVLVGKPLGAAKTFEPGRVHADLTSIISMLTVIRSAAAPTYFQADDFETFSYLGAYNAWGLGDADKLLGDAMIDADRITARLSELSTRKEQKQLNIIAAVLALIGLVGALQASLQLTGLTVSQMSWDRVTIRLGIFLLYVLTVGFVAVKFKLLRLPSWRIRR